MQKAVLNEYKIKMEENLAKQKKYDDFVNIIKNDSIDGINVSPFMKKEGQSSIINIEHGQWEIDTPTRVTRKPFKSFRSPKTAHEKDEVTPVKNVENSKQK